MTPEEIRKQMLASAGSVPPEEVPITPASAPQGTARQSQVSENNQPVERLQHSDAEELERIHQELIASGEIVSVQHSKDFNRERKRAKSMILALVLAVLLGPFGLLYVSWKRAAVMLLIFVVGVSLISKNGFVVLLLWLVAPILSIMALGVGKRQPPSA